MNEADGMSEFMKNGLIEILVEKVSNVLMATGEVKLSLLKEFKIKVEKSQGHEKEKKLVISLLNPIIELIETIEKNFAENKNNISHFKIKKKDLPDKINPSMN